MRDEILIDRNRRLYLIELTLFFYSVLQTILNESHRRVYRSDIYALRSLDVRVSIPST